jgi:hypothetical protein
LRSLQSGSAAAVQPRYGAAALVLGDEAIRTFNAVLQQDPGVSYRLLWYRDIAPAKSSLKHEWV